MSRRDNGWSGIFGIIFYIVIICLAINPFQSSKKENSINQSNNYTYSESNSSNSNKTIRNEFTYDNLDDENSQTVYITNTGSKYHRAGCQYLRKSCHPISKSNAISSGYDACSRCHP